MIDTVKDDEGGQPCPWARVFCLAALFFCLLIPAEAVWGDYLLTLKSGLQIRVHTYRRDGATLHLWTESGSMSLPSDIVVQITEKRSPPSTGPRTSTEQHPTQGENEQSPETHPGQKRDHPLYIPDEEKSPND